jgi:hypothetical protein
VSRGLAYKRHHDKLTKKNIKRSGRFYQPGLNFTEKEIGKIATTKNLINADAVIYNGKVIVKNIYL